MKDRINFSINQGLTFFKADFNSLEGENLFDHVMYCCIEAEKVDEPTVFLIDLRDTKLTLETMNHLADVSKKIQPFVKRSAILGVKSYIKALFKIYTKLTKSKAKTFDKIEDAKQYIGVT